MPSRQPRVSVVKDDELREALDSVRRLLPAASSEASLVRELALLGARHALEAEENRQGLLRDLVAMTTSPDWPYMSEEEIDRLAWGRERG